MKLTGEIYIKYFEVEEYTNVFGFHPYFKNNWYEDNYSGFLSGLINFHLSHSAVLDGETFINNGNACP